MQQFQEKQQAEREEFGAKQRADADSYSQGTHTAEEYDAFYEQQSQDAQAFGERLSKEFEDYVRPLEQEYGAQCGGYSPATGGYGGQYGGPTGGEMPEACRNKQQEMTRAMQEFQQKWMPRFDTFMSQFASDRERFNRGDGGDKDWAGWAAEWDVKAKAMYEEELADLSSTMESHGLSECFQTMGGAKMIPLPDFGGASGGGPRNLKSEYPDWKTQGGYNGQEEDARKKWEACQAAGTDQGECQREIEADFKKYYEEQKGYSGTGGGCQASFDSATGQVIVSGGNHAMRFNPDAQSIEDFSVRGELAIDRLQVNGYVADSKLQSTSDGTSFNYYDADGNVVIQMFDLPSGAINVASSETIPSVILDLADRLTVQRAANGVTFSAGAFHGGVTLWSGTLELHDGNQLEIDGTATFFAASPLDESSPGLEQAVLEKRVGGEIVVGKDGDDLKAVVAAYGDLQVSVKKEDDQKVSATVESDTHDGKTVVLKFDPDVFETDDLDVQVQDVKEGNDTEEFDTVEADSLEDVLDPTDDGERAEYWIVSDKLGTQVLVSLPHFSEKRISIKPSSGESSVTGNPLAWTVGGAGLVGLVLVGVGIRRRRRPPGQRLEVPPVQPVADAPSVPQEPTTPSAPQDAPSDDPPPGTEREPEGQFSSRVALSRNNEAAAPQLEVPSGQPDCDAPSVRQEPTTPSAPQDAPSDNPDAGAGREAEGQFASRIALLRNREEM